MENIKKIKILKNYIEELVLLEMFDKTFDFDDKSELKGTVKEKLKYPYYSEDFEINNKKFELIISPSKKYENAVDGVFKRSDACIKNSEDYDFLSSFSHLANLEYGENYADGDILKIFNYVIQVFYKYIIKYNPEKFIFHARDSKRTKFYNKILNKLVFKINYTAQLEKETDGSSTFILTKN